ncbi:MAG: sigma-70 family RNA polymerase sigma factor [Bacteroidia bacterium]|nr:sigma-70 family RNA polymerase sigma factor [Bacteroidia bacterium]
MDISGLKDDNEILNGCLNGSQQAQRWLFDKYGARMLGICRRYCKNEDDARDIMQDGFVKIFTKISDFKQNSSISTWMTSIMIFTSIDYLRKNSKLGIFQSVENMGEEFDYEDEQPLELKGANLSHEQLLSIIDELPDGCKFVFNMYAIDGMQHKHIATQLGISEGTSKSQLSRARKLLQEKIYSRHQVN